MSSSISIHHVKAISASTVQGGECRPHITINWQGQSSFTGNDEIYEAGGYICFYLDDAELNTKLIEAINRTVREHAAENKANGENVQ